MGHKAKPLRWSFLRSALYLLILVLGLSIILSGLLIVRYLTTTAKTKDEATLVMYIFSNTDPIYAQNLRFFIREAVDANSGCEYVFVIQYADDIQKLDPLPALPANARYVFRWNEGYDWGAFGWLIYDKQVDITKYDYFIFINSSVRGPFLHPSLKGLVSWNQLFTAKLNDKVKLVGPTINCEGTPEDKHRQREQRTNPHVQTYAFATDKIGLQVMLDAREVFRTYESFQDTIYYSEVGSSLAILKAGYNIDSFMIRYQNVDWRDTNTWSCNQRLNPIGQFWYDGISLHPAEAMFVKMKNHLLYNRYDWARTAHKYDFWMQQSGLNQQQENLQSNEWVDHSVSFKVPYILAMERRGGKCFDADFYRKRNQDLNPDWLDDLLFLHFMQFGQFEARQFKFTCDADFSGVIKWYA